VMLAREPMVKLTRPVAVCPMADCLTAVPTRSSVLGASRLKARLSPSPRVWHFCLSRFGEIALALPAPEACPMSEPYISALEGLATSTLDAAGLRHSD